VTTSAAPTAVEPATSLLKRGDGSLDIGSLKGEMSHE
jgi:hypothetical protein